jgi:hypothetical protein
MQLKTESVSWVNCCWSLPAHSFLVPSPIVLVIILKPMGQLLLGPCYNLGIDWIENAAFQKFLYCCVFICCCWNVFNVLLPSASSCSTILAFSHHVTRTSTTVNASWLGIVWISGHLVKYSMQICRCQFPVLLCLKGLVISMVSLLIGDLTLYWWIRPWLRVWESQLGVQISHCW